MQQRLFALQALIDQLFSSLCRQFFDDGWVAAWPLDDL